MGRDIPAPQPRTARDASAHVGGSPRSQLVGEARAGARSSRSVTSTTNGSIWMLSTRYSATSSVSESASGYPQEPAFWADQSRGSQESDDTLPDHNPRFLHRLGPEPPLGLSTPRAGWNGASSRVSGEVVQSEGTQ